MVATIIQDIIKIEKVQRRFTKRLRGLKHLSYSDRLNKLGLRSLELQKIMEITKVKNRCIHELRTKLNKI